MRKMINILLFTLPLIYMMVSLIFISGTMDELMCSKVDVMVKDSLTNNFIDSHDILVMLDKENVKMAGVSMNSINSQKIEDLIDKHPSISKSECYKSINGVFRIEVTQRRPLIRVISETKNFYIDSNGDIMPFSKHYTAFVPVATGRFNDSIKQGLYAFGKYLDEDEFWRAQISQIQIEDEDNIILIPRVGKHIIEFGSFNNKEEKLKRIKTLYQQDFNTYGWNRYQKISVKFENQIVCTKK